MGSKGGDETTTGYRYAFSILSGICRGPVDSVFLVRADGKVFYDLEITDNLNVECIRDRVVRRRQRRRRPVGVLSFYFGKFNQIIPFGTRSATSWWAARDANARRADSFFDGEIGANNPYPKAWQYRIRRAVKGWKNDECWYPEKAMIRLSDSSVADDRRAFGYLNTARPPARRWWTPMAMRPAIRPPPSRR
jgi:hypothetical protein